MLLPVLLMLPVSLMPSAHAGDRQQRVLEPEGEWVGGVAPVPAAPDGCRSTVRVQVPLDVCAGRELATIENRVAPTPGTVETTADDAWCALACTAAVEDGAHRWPAYAGWSFTVDHDGYTGTVTCTLDDGATQTIELRPAGDPVPIGISNLWTTEIGQTSFVSAPGPGTPTWLTGDNLCPDGQPTRDGRTRHALKRNP